MKINLLEAYIVYNKYWMSRKFIDLIGFNFLKNNLMFLNKFFRFEELCDLEKVMWVIMKNNDEVYDAANKELLNIFEEKYKNIPFKDSVDYHLRLVYDDMIHRGEHYCTCAEALKSLNKILGVVLVDNIYSLNQEYVPNFFEEILIKDTFSPLDYTSFVSIIKENIKDAEFEFDQLEVDYKSLKCSV